MNFGKTYPSIFKVAINDTVGLIFMWVEFFPFFFLFLVDVFLIKKEGKDLPSIQRAAWWMKVWRKDLIVLQYSC